MFGRPRAKETYCRDETDPIALPRVSGSVADHEIGEMAKWRMAALQPPWKKTLVFTIIHSRKIQECNFPVGKSPCGMLLADPELVS